MRQFKYWMKKNKRNKACVCLHYWRCQKGNCSCSNEEPTPAEIPLESIGAPSTNSVSLTMGDSGAQVSFNFLPVDANTLNRDVQVVSTDDNIASPALASWGTDGVAYIDILPTGAGTATVTYSFAGTSYDIAVTVEPNYNYTLGVNYDQGTDSYTYHVEQSIPTRSTRGRKKAAGVVEEYYFSIDAQSTPTLAYISQESGSGNSARIFNTDYASQIKARSEAAIQAGTQEAAKDIFNEYKKLYADELETSYYYILDIDEIEGDDSYHYRIEKNDKSGSGETLGGYYLVTNPGTPITEATISSHEDSAIFNVSDVSDAEALKAEILNANSDYRYCDQAYAYGTVVYEKYSQEDSDAKSIKEDIITLDELTK